MKRFVYILKDDAAQRYYTGLTGDVHARRADHNGGRCPHTADGRPWKVDVVIEFADEARAVRFAKNI